MTEIFGVGLLAVELVVILIAVQRVTARVEALENALRAPRPITLDGKATIPRVTFQGTGDFPLSTGVDTLRFNGEPFPFVTQGPITLEFSDDNAVIATIRIPLAMVDSIGPIVAPPDANRSRITPHPVEVGPR